MHLIVNEYCRLYQKVGLPINYYSYYFICPTKHHHPSLITLHSVCNDPSGGRRPAQIPQLDIPQASKESHHHHKILY